VTVVTARYEAGFDNTKIQSVTGHRTSASIDRYKRLRSDKNKYDGFYALTKRLRTKEAEEVSNSSVEQTIRKEPEKVSVVLDQEPSEDEMKPSTECIQGKLVSESASKAFHSIFGSCNLQGCSFNSNLSGN
jgi:hypothetical protein